jgi:hypothetical protein
MKLIDMPMSPRSDMDNHPDMKPHRPHPVGISKCGVQQYDGTNIFQWWKKPGVHWVPHGEPHVIDDV